MFLEHSTEPVLHNPRKASYGTALKTVDGGCPVAEGSILSAPNTRVDYRSVAKPGAREHILTYGECQFYLRRMERREADTYVRLLHKRAGLTHSDWSRGPIVEFHRLSRWERTFRRGHKNKHNLASNNAYSNWAEVTARKGE